MLPGENVAELVDRARGEVEQIRELIDEVLFLSELESGTRVVSLGSVAVRPELDAVAAELEERASRAGVALVVEGDPEIELAIRPRMIRVVAQNLAENAIRYAGPGATFTLAIERVGDDGRPPRHGRRRRRRGGAARAALRALLPRRPGARLARDGARSRDREARRHAGRRHGRGARRAGGGPRDPLHVPARADAAALVHQFSHQTFTIPEGPRGRQRTRRDTASPVSTRRRPRLQRRPGSTRARSIATELAGDPSSHLASRTPPRGSEVVFDVEGLSVSYGGALALDGVDLEIRKNFVTAFIGPSGCGKSTFIRCFNRMNDLIPGAVVDGRVLYHGRDLYALERRPGRGAPADRDGLPEAEPVPEVDLRQHRLRPARARLTKDLDERVERTLRHAALWDEVKDRLKENALGLSGGQQQRLCIARALAVEPDVILMDEPASALDPISTSRIEDLIHELKREYTIVIVTHNMQQAARVADMTAFFSVEVREDGTRPPRDPRRVRPDDEDLHEPVRPAGRRTTSPGGSGSRWHASSSSEPRMRSRQTSRSRARSSFARCAARSTRSRRRTSSSATR